MPKEHPKELKGFDCEALCPSHQEIPREHTQVKHVLHEVLEVIEAETIPHPEAVMVSSEHTLSAYLAVVDPRWLHLLTIDAHLKAACGRQCQPALAHRRRSGRVLGISDGRGDGVELHTINGGVIFPILPPNSPNQCFVQVLSHPFEVIAIS